MPKTEKSPNYSEVQEQEMSMVYQSSKTDDERAEDVKQLAMKFGKTVQSIRAKLSKLNVYIKPAKVAKDGKPVTRKSDLVAVLKEKLGIEGNELDSMEKANKTALEMVINQMTFLEESFSE